MKTFLRPLFLFSIFGSVLAGYAPAQVSRLVIYGIKGPSALAMIRLFENPPKIAGFDVRAEALSQADQVAARLISGEAKIGMLPPNLAAKIASSGRKIQIGAVTGTGMISLLSSNPGIKSIGDLRGGTVNVAGQAATPDYVFRRILLSKGLNPDRDLKLDYSLAPAEIAQALIAGRISTALIPEPFSTMVLGAGKNIKPVTDIQAEWTKAGGAGNYPMTVLVLDSAFAAANPQAAAAVLSELKASVEWVLAHPAEAGALGEKHDLGVRAATINAAIPRSGYVFIPAREARPSLESLFKTFLEFAPASIGGALPGDDFYR